MRPHISLLQMISKFFIALLFLALTSSVNAAAIPRQYLCLDVREFFTDLDLNCWLPITLFDTGDRVQ